MAPFPGLWDCCWIPWFCERLLSLDWEPSNLLTGEGFVGNLDCPTASGWVNRGGLKGGFLGGVGVLPPVVGLVLTAFCADGLGGVLTAGSNGSFLAGGDVDGSACSRWPLLSSSLGGCCLGGALGSCESLGVGLGTLLVGTGGVAGWGIGEAWVLGSVLVFPVLSRVSVNWVRHLRASSVDNRCVEQVHVFRGPVEGETG